MGDAAGRKVDHSSCDIQWAKNVGIQFYTPEQFFWEKVNLVRQPTLMPATEEGKEHTTDDASNPAQDALMKVGQDPSSSKRKAVDLAQFISID